MASFQYQCISCGQTHAAPLRPGGATYLRCIVTREWAWYDPAAFLSLAAAARPASPARRGAAASAPKRSVRAGAQRASPRGPRRAARPAARRAGVKKTARAGRKRR